MGEELRKVFDPTEASYSPTKTSGPLTEILQKTTPITIFNTKFITLSQREKCLAISSIPSSRLKLPPQLEAYIHSHTPSHSTFTTTAMLSFLYFS